MKSISILLNVILIFLVFYLGCKDKFFAKNDESGKPSAYCAKEGCETYNPSEKYGMISYRTAKMLSENYYADSGKRYIYDGAVNTGVPDARNIWFSLKVLKNFIALIESSVCKAGCNEEQGLGIRIYYGKYPRKEEFSQYPDIVGSVPDSFENRHTVFMMPTYHDAVLDKEFDFDPREVAANCVFKPLNKNLPYFAGSFRQSVTQMQSKQSRVQVPVQDSATYGVMGGAGTRTLFFKSSDGTTEQQNHGTLAPPPDAEGSYPTSPEIN